MANDWIPVRTTLPQCREVALIAGVCTEDPDLVVGRLIRFWTWLDAETADGRLPGMTIETLALALRMPTAFFEAMAKVGWLIVTADGLSIPNWDRWFAKSSKKRLQAAARMAGSRQDMGRPTDHESPHTDPDTDDDVAPAAQQERNQRRTHVALTANKTRTNVAPAANETRTESEQKRNHRTEQKRIDYLNDDVDDDVKGEKGGSGEKGGPPPDPRPLYEAHAVLWPNGRVVKKRDRVLLWRVATLATLGHTWAAVALQSLADGRPTNPGAYLQKLVFELGPREPHVGLILGEVPVPAEIANPRPPAQGPPQPAQSPTEKPLTPEEGRAMVAELMAVVRHNGKHGGDLDDALRRG